ncbi:MMPL family transporter [Planococcus sp. APC 4015]|nr:MMPL family transporter [Planococcus sp. APC 4015]
MSTLLYALGRWSYRHPWRVLVSWILLLGIAGGSAAVFSTGTDNSFSIPGTESQAGLEQLNRTFPQVSGTSAQIVIVADDGESVTTEPYASAITDAVADLDDIDGVLGVTDPFDELVTGLVNDDESAAIIRLQFDGQATDVSPESKAELTAVADELESALPAASQVALGGDLFSQSVPGVTVTELIGILIALLVLMVTFRSFLVAGIPLATALVGVGLSMALILLATAFASISSTTPLLALMLGLAVGIDYALFIAARHQDQVRGGMDPEESAARATGTAGSAVVFAGVTVLIALIGLGFAGIPFLTTMGIAASVAVALSVAVAITLTPALLGFVKGRVVGRMPKGRRASTSSATTVGSPATTGGSPATTADAGFSDGSANTGSAPTTRAKPPRRGFATRWVELITRHPIVTTVTVVAALGVLAVPASSLALALPNAGVQPVTSQARQSYDLAAEQFGPGFNGPLIMTGTIVTSTDPLGLMEDLAAEIEDVPGVKEIALATPNETADTGIIQIIPETAPDSPETAQLVRDLRVEADRLYDEYGIDLSVTGFTAVGIDISDRLGAALLPFGLFVVGLSFILLMIVFRSIAVPITATLGYLLSVVAAFGVVAAVFEWGWFADLLHIARVGPVISFMPIVLMGVLFGLAMDYQVFLVSRMREDYVHAVRRGEKADKATAVAAVRSGFTASARVVTAAAFIMFAVFAAFVPEGDSSIKPIALGLAAGIAIDAFLVRMTLIPAVMALLGAKAWWMPRRLERLLPHFDIEGEAVEREIALTDWPEPDSTAAIVGEDVSVRAETGRAAGEVVLFERASFRVEDGGTLIATGDPRAARAFALTVAGRLTPDDGLLRVAGHLLPGRAAWVRAHVGVALLADADDPVRELRRALRGRTRLVVIDGIDTLDAAGRDQAAALLRDADGLTVVATSQSDGAALAVLADAHRSAPTSLSLRADARIPASEVTS